MKTFLIWEADEPLTASEWAVEIALDLARDLLALASWLALVALRTFTLIFLIQSTVVL